MRGVGRARRFAKRQNRQHGEREQPGHASEHHRPVGLREDPQQQTAAENHAETIGADLNGVREATLARVEHADRQPVSHHVLRCGDDVECERSDDQHVVVAFEIELRQHQRRGDRGELQKEQPAAARAAMIEIRGPQKLQRPGQRQQTERADRFEREAGVAQQHRQREREESKRQPLREIQRDQQRDLVRARHELAEGRTAFAGRRSQDGMRRKACGRIELDRIPRTQVIFGFFVCPAAGLHAASAAFLRMPSCHRPSLL